MGYDTERAEWSLYNEEYQEAMEGPDGFDIQTISCGCDNSSIKYIQKRNIYRCQNCGWCSL
jgi:hypothetical protein